MIFVNNIVCVYLTYRRISPISSILVNMSTYSQRRKQITKLVPEGSLVTRSWLQAHEFTNHAIDNLLKSQQLETVKNGVYKRAGSKIEWGDVVYFLQRQLSTDLTIGGISALELQKLAHYLPISEQRLVHLYGRDNLPVWVNGLETGARFQKHSSRDLFGNSIEDEKVSQLVEFTKVLNWKNTNEGLRIATPEIAILEVMNQVPGNISFEHADELMQGLNTLSPRTLQKLLELCTSVKVRRMFFYLAERQNHNWFTKLQTENIDFGSGNRVIVKGGKLNKKYKITVPDFYE
ncbi:hypothetical protein F1649_15625 [Arcticibacter tournemirensis]|uniref:Transcriptional regulator AbiEi antitoxin N-terminal domain-containing protein n=2 Tax=Arcticibacter tournemirensis TaxID=699437 RepID=A0A5M9H4G0_9SPHI|nr:hypothetical protein F1649_15625 [Arcticibacter tournemirensis]